MIKNNIIRIILIALFLVFTPKILDAQVIPMETANTSLIYAVDPDKRLLFCYYGSKLNDTEVFVKNRYQDRDKLAFVISDPLNCDAYTSFGNVHVNEPALHAVHSDGSLMTDLIFQKSETVLSNDPNVKHLVVYLKDKLLDFNVQLHTETFYKEDVFNQWVVITNNEKGNITLKNFNSGHLYLYANSYFLTHFDGSWGMEMGMQEEELSNGIKIIETKKGVRNTLTENSAFLISFNHAAQENAGEVIGGALAWSGNYRMTFQVDEWNRLNILGGINPFLSDMTLQKGQILETPKMVYTYTNKGRGQVSRNLHDWARSYSLAGGFSPCQVVLNSWEGSGFNFDEKTLTDMMDESAKLGVEVFVLDDGWFGNKYPRDNDTSGLGDWQVNKRKIPHGITYLAEYARKKGLKFGLWIEPEMVNPKSELAIAHPDWVVQSPNREKFTFRNQWVLDLSNPNVQNLIWKIIDDLLEKNPTIDYIKWDSNRHLDQIGSTYLSTANQNDFFIRYTNGLYSIYEKIRKKYPGLMMQVCSSGGGRVDFGSLKYHHEFWASDNTDPLQRIFIQYGTNMIYPPVATASHVTKSGNGFPLKFRFDVAMTGRLGIELLPEDLSPEEKNFTVTTIESYKHIRDIIAGGDLYRILSPYDPGNWASLMYVSKDKKRAVVYAFSLGYHKQGIFPTLNLKGLNPALKYKVSEINKAEHSFWGNKDNKYFWGDDQGISGDFLINAGMELAITRPYDSAVFLLEAE